MKLSDQITSISGVGEKTANILKKLNLQTIEDLIFFLPRRIEDRSNLVKIAQLPFGQDCVISGKIVAVHSRRTRRGSLLIEAKITDETGNIPAIWFNQKFVLSQLPVGQEIMLYGNRKLAPTIGNPFVVKKIISVAEFVPIYPLTKGLHQGVINRLIKKILPLAEKIPDVLPEPVTSKYHLAHRAQALRAVHEPVDSQELEDAKKLLGFEELLGLAIATELSKNERTKIIIDKLLIDGDYMKKFTASLPFPLTDGQRKVAWKIIQELTSNYPTNQLLYGEVGSGKTIVSLLAAMAIIRSGARVLILVPTTTLAAQQVASIRKLVGPKISVSQITSAIKEETTADIIIGTHALLHQANQLENIGLIIIDEQQRFGVRQRQELSLHHPSAHLLMTTATPIPRSLAQTIFGNLTISYLTDKPAHQQKVTTQRFQSQDRPSVLAEIRRRLAVGEAGYVICPAIEETEQDLLFEEDEKKSVAKELKKLSKELPKAKIAALHGRMSSDEKTKILRQFLDGQIDVLVATTVVEVGIDNPNATWMIIENAEMFGLSTLHQLRGRVGRGSKPAVCFVSQTTTDDQATRRLEMFEESQDGLALAEADLALRGPGEILGSEQSGLPTLKYADLSDKKLIKVVFDLAKQIVKDGIEKYPTLKPIIKEVDGLAAS